MKHTQFNVTPDLYASKGQRFVNFIIDYVVQLIIGFLFGIVIALIINFTQNETLYEWFFVEEARWKDYLFGIVILLIYYSVIESITAHSVGKYVTKTKIVMEDGSKPSASDIFLRTLCRLIPFEQFSFLGDEARGWHDSMSKTIVVDKTKFEAKLQSINDLEELGKDQEHNLIEY